MKTIYLSLELTFSIFHDGLIILVRQYIIYILLISSTYLSIYWRIYLIIYRSDWLFSKLELVNNIDIGLFFYINISGFCFFFPLLLFFKDMSCSIQINLLMCSD